MDRSKKILPFLFVGIFVSWAIYKFFFENPYRLKKDQESLKLDWQELDNVQSVETKNQVPLTIKNKIEKTPEEGNEKKVDDQEIFLAFDEVERKWLETVKPIFGTEHYQIYLELREKNENEKMEAYKAYHDFLQKKYGDKFEYNISEDQGSREKEINQLYLKKLLDILGKEKFQKYLNARDVYNEGTRRSGKQFLPMEF